MLFTRNVNKLSQLIDVSLTTPTDGQALKYDAASGKWVAGTAGIAPGSNVTLGDVTANTFTGSGSGLTNLSASNIASGTLNAGRLPGTASFSTLSAISNATGNVPFLVKGFAGQTANLSEWRNSGGGLIGSVDKLGNATFLSLTTNYNVSALGYFGDGSNLTGYATGLTVGNAENANNASYASNASYADSAGVAGSAGSLYDVNSDSYLNDYGLYDVGWLQFGSNGASMLFNNALDTDQPIRVFNADSMYDYSFVLDGVGNLYSATSVTSPSVTGFTVKANNLLSYSGSTVIPINVQSPLIVSENSIGTTSTDALSLVNTTTGSRQYSPRLRLQGNGRNTSGAGSDVAAAVMMEVETASQASDNLAAGSFSMQFGVNGTYAEFLNYNKNSGTVTFSGSSAVANGFTANTSGVTSNRNNIGTTSTDGLLLQNTTAATSGTVQYAPKLHFTGSGWQTDNANGVGPNVARTVDVWLQVEPISSAFVGASNTFSNVKLYTQAQGTTAQTLIAWDNFGSATMLNKLTTGGSISVNSNALSQGTGVFNGGTFAIAASSTVGLWLGAMNVVSSGSQHAWGPHVQLLSRVWDGVSASKTVAFTAETQTTAGTSYSGVYTLAYKDNGGSATNVLTIDGRSKAATFAGDVTANASLWTGNGTVNASAWVLRTAGGSLEQMQWGARNTSITTYALGLGAVNSTLGPYLNSTTVGTNASSQRYGNYQLLDNANNATSGTYQYLQVLPVYNQLAGSTAANTDLLINRTQTAVGSGAQLLIQAQVGSVNKGTLDTSGNLRLAGSLGVGNWQSATTLGTVNGKVEVFDSNGNSKGFLPTYASIT